MSGLPINSSFYSVGGPLLQDAPSYLTRKSDTELYETLKAGKFCYVLNSRQMGKSSLMVRTLAKLEAGGWVGSIIDFSGKDSQVDRPDRWYNGIINQLNNQFDLLEWQAFRTWLKERDFIAPVERLAEFIETVLLPGVEQPIVIFIDEIDSTLGLPFTDDFFALIRVCFNKRPQNPAYRRLTFALLGVAAPSELIGDAKRTPFNVGESIDLKGFTPGEALPLAAGLQGKAEQPETVLQEILRWTGGQPFLTQRLCQLVVDSDGVIAAGSEAVAIDGLVNTRLIDSWETQDHQEHLKTIRQRLLDDERKAGYLLELYRQIWQAQEISANNQPEERDLQLSGLIVKRDSKLRIYNPIYTAVFDETWIDTELRKLRPYAESFRAWVMSGKADRSRLLRGGALTEAEAWASEKATLSAEDREFLAASRAQQREEEISAREREAELAREKTAREAAEEAEQIQAEANLQAQRKIRRGNFVLGGALMSTILFGTLTFFSSVALKQIQQEQQEIAEHNETAKVLSRLIDDLHVNNKPEAAMDAIEQLGLSFTDFTEGKIVFKEALLNSSIALVNLHLTSSLSDDTSEGVRERIKDAQKRIEQSIRLIEANPNEFKLSASGRSIAFFTYAVQGNLQEERDYLRGAQQEPSKAYPSYELAFRYTSETPNFKSESVGNSFSKLLSPFSDYSKDNQFQSLVTASLKKHYDFRARQSIRDLELVLAQYLWRKADRLTSVALASSAYSKDLKTILPSSIPCNTLRKVDSLWSEYSAGHFGFSVQKEIYEKINNTAGVFDASWIRFTHEVGWSRVSGNIEAINDVRDSRIEWLSGNELLWSEGMDGNELKASGSPSGHLPIMGRIGTVSNAGSNLAETDLVAGGVVHNLLPTSGFLLSSLTSSQGLWLFSRMAECNF
ncbi:hypothetical protein Lepto7375DRAFT_7575 [Leptolyngbya sp. PCC 7375]|nr:hypothetical protein Lepto7375DRAFT_7575 [Leptolyngbya sp. PCC 7375]